MLNVEFLMRYHPQFYIGCKSTIKNNGFTTTRERESSTFTASCRIVNKSAVDQFGVGRLHQHRPTFCGATGFHYIIRKCTAVKEDIAATKRSSSSPGTCRVIFVENGSRKFCSMLITGQKNSCSV